MHIPLNKRFSSNMPILLYMRSLWKIRSVDNVERRSVEMRSVLKIRSLPHMLFTVEMRDCSTRFSPLQICIPYQSAPCAAENGGGAPSVHPNYTL